METALIKFSGRYFSADDIELIKSTIAAYPNLPQTELASTVCELIGWVQINGNPKTVQCLSYLRKLEESGVIKLPPSRASKAIRIPASGQMLNDGIATVGDDETYSCDTIQLEVVQSKDSLKRWQLYMRDYHILGVPNAYGNQMRYMIMSDTERDLGCLLFSAASWALAPRDKLIGWSPAVRKERLHLIVNNSRFLVLPGVQIKNMASRALSMSARRIQSDWLRRYCYSPVLLETFVDTAKYKGTSYKASNWRYIGETQGRGRNDRQHEQPVPRKAIYIYPLQQDFISVLKGDKPFTMLDPEAL